ncbi:MAG: hypothetical protein V4736_00475 [Bdellovibrionota bacterium]
MNKLISLIVFAVALIWSWNKVHTANAVNFETHAGIQIKLAELIRETLAQKLPNAENIRITRLWTEAVSSNEVKAIFGYEFTQPLEEGEKVQQAVEGQAFLSRSGEHSDEWKLDRVATDASNLSFSEGTIVSPLNETGAPVAVPINSEAGGDAVAPAASADTTTPTTIPSESGN